MACIPPNANDGCLVAAALAGDAEAFAQIVARYQSPLVRAAFSRLGRREWAEEAVQETMLAAHRWLASYDSRYSFRTWLWTILLNQCTRLAQRESRHVAAGRLPTVSEGMPEWSREPVCPGLSPLQRLLAQERQEQLHALLSRLPEAQADALRLRFFGELTFPEIAAAMRCSEPGAKHRVRAGLVTLSKWLADGDATAGGSRAAEPACVTTESGEIR